MKAASAGLIAFLNSSNQFIMADLYTVTLANATVYRWTSAGTPIVLSGDTFLAAPDAPIISRDRTRWAIGLEVSQITVKLESGDGGYLLGGVRLPFAAEAGVFDDAEILVERVFMPFFGDTSLGAVTLFLGDVARVETTSTSATLTVESAMARLSRQMPRNLFMPSCSHVLFDAGCALSRASFAVAGTVASGLTPTVLSFRTSLTDADGYYELGVITFTSGALNGVARPVRAYLNANGLTTVAVSLPQAPAIGDSFSIIPGCDKTRATCDAKFSNLNHFRGFPFVPPPEAAR